MAEEKTKLQKEVEEIISSSTVEKELDQLAAHVYETTSVQLDEEDFQYLIENFFKRLKNKLKKLFKI